MQSHNKNNVDLSSLKVGFILPAFNEYENIFILLEQIKSIFDNKSIIIIDDSTNDSIKNKISSREDILYVKRETKLNERFRSSDTVERAILEEKKYNFLYEDEKNCHFMDQTNFEQIQINKSLLGEKSKLLKENMEVNVQFYDTQALSIDLPLSVELKIESTDAAIKGQTASSSYKPATLENGINISVPPFINSGDKIVLDTRTLEYVKKTK